jgi:hypothetical protein
MDYHTMELVQLKEIAKQRKPKIKRYYIMSRAELIRVLSLETLPADMILEKKTIRELQEEAKAKGIPKVWSFRRHQLIEILYPHSGSSTEKHNKNDDDGKEHNDPKKS